MKFVKCVIYLAFLSFFSFVIGRLLPKCWFPYEKFPYKSFPVEKEGAVYNKISIRSWKNKLLDMSVIFHERMPSKALWVNLQKGQLVLMIQETCVAEFIHILIGVLGFYCVVIWEGSGGVLVSVLYLLGNIPFCLVQRYNRPKLVRLLKQLQKRGLIEARLTAAEK